MISLTPNWTKTGTKQYLESTIGRGFKLLQGWHETDDESTLVIPVLCYTSEPEYTVYFWDAPEVRAELCNLIGMPVRKMNASSHPHSLPNKTPV